ncbi:hypothetical protein [Bradyrhizobium sp. UNPF46]|uniref:hypothetical protein n=1 Tax=Bradyrhizobium sp. UNPF46 TaxID=1141168 RepID=UPI0015F043ED|nr:hypothetical protein [Bradyrhizobium sp. UNPF46]
MAVHIDPPRKAVNADRGAVETADWLASLGSLGPRIVPIVADERQISAWRIAVATAKRTILPSGRYC